MSKSNRRWLRGGRSTVSDVESSMPSSPNLEQGLLASWSSNASAWTRLVREGLLRSRVEVTNAAILEAVGPTQSGTLLDLGCGEGWLAHLLVERGWTVLGVDAVSELIETARSGPGEFLCAEYEKLGTVLEGRKLDCVVANFSLLGETSTETALRDSVGHLKPGGRLVIQTLHPCSITPYVDGWRQEDWSGMSDSCAPQPWYFRTLQTWIALLNSLGLKICALLEPRAEGAEHPSSLVLIAGSTKSSPTSGSNRLQP